MAHAEKCPVCDGKGRIFDDNYAVDSATVPTSKTCQGCGGRGWVEVSDTVLQPDYIGKYHILPTSEGTGEKNHIA